MTAKIDPLDLAVSRILREKQADTGITAGFLSKKAAIHPRTLLRILNGERAATLGELRALALVLRTTASEIATEAERVVKDV